MTETKRNIKALREALPHMREKVIAVAVLLALSVTMLTSVSFAWYTMSSAPEIGSIRTTVSANGSLEVALAGRYDLDGNLIEPANSTTGDSFAAEGQTALNANLTWGNLINLSNYYGVENLVLRPATFKERSPAFLTSMTYSEDGRVNMATNKFDFTSWLDTAEGPSFIVPESPLYGVRAISSVRFQETDMEAKLNVADFYFAEAASNYSRIVSDTGYLSAIKAVLQIFIDSNVPGSSGDASFTPDQVWSLYQMMSDLCTSVFGNYGEALVGLANAKVPTDPYTLETFLDADVTELNKKGIDLDNSYSLFKTNYAKAMKDRDTLKALAENARSTNTNVPWTSTEDPTNDLESIVDRLVHTNSVKLVDGSGKEYGLSDISRMGTSELISFGMGLPNTIPIVIYNGILKDIELMTGSHMNAQINSLSVLILTKNCLVRTYLYNANFTTTYELDRETIASGGPVYTGKKEAEDTYGMVIDLWVRTNAADAMLILDGMPKTVTYEALRKVVPSGTAEATQAFLYTYYTGNEITAAGQTLKETVTVQLFQIPEDLNGDGTVSSREYIMELNGEEVTIIVYEGYFYDTTTHSQVRLRDEQGDFVPMKDGNGNSVVDEEGNEAYVNLTHEHFWDTTTDVEVETYTYDVVTGFGSSNRIDNEYSDEAGLGFETSTTQGSGSCYIFYASPEEADSTLALLSHLKLVFCDATGNKLARAKLAVDYVFADSGKYVVPLMIEEESGTLTYERIDENGDIETCFAITALTQNEAMRISVVVYLDGEGLENSMVMEKGTVNGSLNLQFASSADLSSLGDSELSAQTISVKADVSKDALRDVTNMDLEFDPLDAGKTTVTLKATITGTTPNNVQAIFRRRVNVSQGAAMEAVTLGADMTATVTFTRPGVYVLRSLWVDGVEYPLPESSWITVNVVGFSVNDVFFCDAAGEELALTAEKFASRDISISFNKGEQVNSVAVRFLDDNNQPVDVTLSSTNDPDKWSGTVRFRSSGHYTLSYVKVNGEFYEVPVSLRKEFTAYLGLRAEVALQSVNPGIGLNFPFKGTEEFKIFTKIKTDTGEELKNLTDLTLYYGRRGSSSTINSPLTWNAAGYYTGTFNITGVGVYEFSHVRIGQSNAITEYNIAATITAQATNPPDYTLLDLPVFDNASGAYVSDLLIMSDVNNPDNGTVRGAYYVVKLHESLGAESFTAVFIDAKGNEHLVTTADRKEINDGTGDIEVSFKIPSQNAFGNSNGDWYVKEIRIAGVYDANGKFYGETDNPGDNYGGPYYLLTNAAEKLHEFSVLQSLTTNLTPITVNNEFMVGEPLMDSTKKHYLNTPVSWDAITHGPSVMIDTVSVTLKHKENSMASYYSVNSYGSLGSYTEFDFQLEYNAEDGKWYVPDTERAYVAGTYTYQMVVTLNTGDVFTIDGSNSTVLTVDTTKPTVTITAISPTGTFDVDTTGVGSGHTSATVPAFTATSATVYFKCSRSGEGSTCNPYRHNYSRPSVTITLGHKGEATDVKMSFGSGIQMYNGTTKVDSYSWTGNGPVARNIGGYESKTAQSDGKTPAGTLTSSELELTFDGIVFRVAVPTITINNPY